MGPKEVELKKLLLEDFRKSVGPEKFQEAVRGLDNPSAYDLYEYEPGVKVCIYHLQVLTYKNVLFLFSSPFSDNQLLFAFLCPPNQEQLCIPTSGGTGCQCSLEKQSRVKHSPAVGQSWQH